MNAIPESEASAPAPGGAALDRPIWSALTSAQAGIAEGGALAKRYPADMAPFAALRDETPAAYAALGALIPANGTVAIFSREPISPPDDLVVERSLPLVQMAAPGVTPRDRSDLRFRELGDADAHDMLRLTGLTKPGPFAARTHRLGRYIGLHDAGALVAMAGERMRLDGHVELSAVCVDPGYRGKGYARALLESLMAAAVRRGLVPFLHVAEQNAGAIALYRDLGFELRLRAQLSIVRQAR